MEYPKLRPLKLEVWHIEILHTPLIGFIVVVVEVDVADRVILEWEVDDLLTASREDYLTTQLIALHVTKISGLRDFTRGSLIVEVVGILIRKVEGVGGFRDGVPEVTVVVGIDAIQNWSRTIHPNYARSVGVVVLAFYEDQERRIFHGCQDFLGFGGVSIHRPLMNLLPYWVGFEERWIPILLDGFIECGFVVAQYLRCEWCKLVRFGCRLHRTIQDLLQLNLIEEVLEIGHVLTGLVIPDIYADVSSTLEVEEWHEHTLHEGHIDGGGEHLQILNQLLCEVMRLSGVGECTRTQKRHDEGNGLRIEWFEETMRLVLQLQHIVDGGVVVLGDDGFLETGYPNQRIEARKVVEYGGISLDDILELHNEALEPLLKVTTHPFDCLLGTHY